MNENVDGGSGSVGDTRKGMRQLTDAERFLLNRIESEAALEGRPLMDIERRVLLDREESPAVPGDEFPSDNFLEFVERCKTLLARARDREVEIGGQEAARRYDQLAGDCDSDDRIVLDGIPLDSISEKTEALDGIEIRTHNLPRWIDRTLLVAAALVTVVIALGLAFANERYAFWDRAQTHIEGAWQWIWGKFGSLIISLILALALTFAYLIGWPLLKWKLMRRSSDDD